MSDSGDDQTGVPLFEGFSDSDVPPSSKKRKHDGPAKGEKKASKRRKLKKPKDLDEEALDVDLGVNHAIEHMDSRLLADHIAQRTKRFQSDLSLVEVEEMYVPGGCRLCYLRDAFLMADFGGQRKLSSIARAGRNLGRRRTWPTFCSSSQHPDGRRKDQSFQMQLSRRGILTH